MSIEIDRRLLLKAGALGLGALAVPGAAQVLGGRGFSHGVASGEPRQNSVMLWTRYLPGRGETGRLSWQVSPSADFGRILAQGPVTAEDEHDHCVKPVATGLAPGRWYFYRFRDARGRSSPVGRTRTLPEGPTERFRIGIFSCANMGFGWFNAYAHAAARRDLDLLLHLGDYFYEFEQGRYPADAERIAGREIEPLTEVATLAGYRLRHAAYRRDPDLQRLHQFFPMVMMWDDHESANDSWHGGAVNHQPETEGPWAVRKAAAKRAYREWLPVSEQDWDSYEIGDLATLFRPETRLTARSEPLSLAAVLGHGGDPAAALVAFRDGPWRDPARTMMGPAQEAWLAGGFRRSVAAGTKWQLLGQQVIMGTAGLAASRAGLPFNLDRWDGFPAARERLLRSALDADANLVVLSGDSHNAWGFDLALGGDAAGVEFAGQSVTSPGYETYLSWIDPADLARVSVAFNPGLKWMDASRRGYMILELTPERATGEWLLLNTVRQRSTAIASRHSMTTARGANRLG
jgi:alkaline phosphatase D